MSRALLRVAVAALVSLASAVGTVGLTTGLTRDGVAPQRPGLNVVGLGDSVMAGTACGCSGITQQFAEGWGHRLGRRVSAVNLGVSGDTTSLLGGRLATEPATLTSLHSADVVLVIEGANDLVPQLQTWRDSSCPASCYRPAVAAMGQRLERALLNVRGQVLPGAQVVVAGYWNVFADGNAARADGGQEQIDWSRALTRDANAAIAAATRHEHAAYVDLTSALDTDGDHDPTPLLADDGDHPNQAGVTRIVSALLAVTGLPTR